MNIKNLALSTVETAPNPATTGTTIVLETGTGNRFPDTANGDFFITAMPSDEQPHIDNSEILKVTDRTNDTLTVVRAQRGSTAKAISAGWIILVSVHKEDMTPEWKELTFSATPVIDLNSGIKQFITLTGNAEFSINNVTDSRVFMIKIIQDEVGGHSVTWDSGLDITWLTPVFTVGENANAITVFGFIKTGTNAYDGYLMGNT